MPKQILVPLDFSEVSKQVVKIADEWGQRSNAQLYFFHTTPATEAEYEMRESEGPIFSREETTTERLFKGSTTDHLLHHATCPMYVYKERSI